MLGLLAQQPVQQQHSSVGAIGPAIDMHGKRTGAECAVWAATLLEAPRQSETSPGNTVGMES